MSDLNELLIETFLERRVKRGVRILQERIIDILKMRHPFFALYKDQKKINLPIL
jgi:hypothetical protein